VSNKSKNKKYEGRLQMTNTTEDQF